MKMRSLFFVSLICISMCSCKEKGKNNIQDTSIPLLKDLSENINVDKMFGEFEYISLETSERSLFSSIDKLIVHDNKFFILDKANRKRIFVFSEDGEFIRTIGRVGKGPGEYSNIEDFTIDEDTHNIIVLCYPSIVITYDFSGKFFRQKKLTSSAMLWNICSYEDGYICSSNHESVLKGKEAFLIFNFDKEFNLREKLLNVLPVHIAMPPLISNPLLKSGNEIVYFDSFALSVHFNVNNNNNDVRTIHFNFEGKEVPTDLYVDPHEFFEKQADYCFFLDAILVDHILLSSFANKGRQCVSIINLKTGQKSTHRMDRWFPKLLYYQDNYFYSTVNLLWIIDGHDFFDAKKTTKYPIDINSNPVILKFKATFL